MQINNPYSEMIKLMQVHGSKYNPWSLQLGEVTSIDPLTIKTGDLQLNKSNLFIADYLKAEYTRSIKIPETSAQGATDEQTVGDHGSHKHAVTDIGIEDGKIIYKEIGLDIGDNVALIQLDDAAFLILCKVVRA